MDDATDEGLRAAITTYSDYLRNIATRRPESETGRTLGLIADDLTIMLGGEAARTFRDLTDDEREAQTRMFRGETW
jgi:hypothetical protein